VPNSVSRSSAHDSPTAHGSAQCFTATGAARGKAKESYGPALFLSSPMAPCWLVAPKRSSAQDTGRTPPGYTCCASRAHSLCVHAAANASAKTALACVCP
jgi:hypothetical protein